jgi:hypothetical protein
MLSYGSERSARKLSSSAKYGLAMLFVPQGTGVL